MTELRTLRSEAAACHISVSVRHKSRHILDKQDDGLDWVESVAFRTKQHNKLDRVPEEGRTTWSHSSAADKNVVERPAVVQSMTVFFSKLVYVDIYIGFMYDTAPPPFPPPLPRLYSGLPLPFDDFQSKFMK